VEELEPPVEELAPPSNSEEELEPPVRNSHRRE
jgi:hypothetical protein